GQQAGPERHDQADDAGGDGDDRGRGQDRLILDDGHGHASIRLAMPSRTASTSTVDSRSASADAAASFTVFASTAWSTPGTCCSALVTTCSTMAAVSALRWLIASRPPTRSPTALICAWMYSSRLRESPSVTLICSDRYGRPRLGSLSRARIAS